uniref:ATP synthase complex subunit 8 n=1 Tax=Eumecichthys fiski TaxID=1263185 RepID=A0A8S0FFH8_9TELE|nr:ATPase subunits 8 [Eumecichthys fiski]
MPQLNPSPWFLILAFSWIVFLTILPPKILAHTTPNEPSTKTVDNTKTTPWSWPWH